MSRRAEWAIVGCALVSVVAAASVWLAVDQRPWEWDHANHLERVVRCANDLGAGRLTAILEESDFYPPLVLCGAAVVYRWFPSDVAAAQSVVLVFLAIGILAVYLLGRRLAGGTEGAVAALLFASAPFVVFSAIRFQLDLPLASMVAVAFATLVRSEGFGHRAWSLATGLAVGLGMLVKPPFAVYLLPGLALEGSHARNRRALLNLAGALALAGAFAIPWYGPRLLGVVSQISARSFKQAAESGYPATLSAAGLIFYPKFFIMQFGLVAVALLGVGLIVAVRTRRWLPLAALFAPLAVFELIQNKNLRYTLPLLPVASVIAGMGFTALGARLRALGAGAVVVLAGLQVSATLIGVPPPVDLPLVNAPFVLDSPPMRGDWHQRDILRLILQDSGGKASRVSVVPNDNFFSVSNFRYYAARDGLPLTFTRAWDGAPLGIDYVVLKTGALGPVATVERPRRVTERFAEDAHLARLFPVIGEFDLPDGSVGTLRARRLPVGVPVAPPRLARSLDLALRRQLTDFARGVEGFALTLDYDDAITRGRIRRVRITAAKATVGELRRAYAVPLSVSDIRIVVDDLLVNPYRLAVDGGFEPLDVGRVRIEGAVITGEELQRLVRSVPRFRTTSLTLGDGFVAVHVRERGPDMRARLRFVPVPGRPFGLVAEGVRIGGLPVPDALVSWVVRNYDPSPKIASRLPVPVELGRVTVGPAGVRISGPP